MYDATVAAAYGLTASIMTAGVWKGITLGAQVQAGMVNINGPTMGGELQIALGGVKDSGWARFGRWAVDRRLGLK